VSTIRLLGAGDVRALASQLGVRPTKRLGQNFVLEPGTVRQVAALAGPLTAQDVVLEVGPGLGSLTLALLEATAPSGARVVAVEIDPLLAARLPKTIADRAPADAGRLQVVEADALEMTTLPGAPPTLLAANLPYNIAVPVVLHLLATFPSVRGGVIMVQAEVAERLCAGPGSRVYGVPSAKLAWYATASQAGMVPRSVFWPVPNVDSKLVVFTRHEAGGADVTGMAGAGRQDVFRVIDAAFGQRRKTLRAALATWAGSAVEAERVLRTAGVDPGARGESIGIADFARIASAAQAAPVARSSQPAGDDKLPRS
jgi:16S rRNA (adenine1518-N6/adenine1519-N6)-dimethyltransferase